MRARSHRLLEQAVTDGVRMGVTRFFGDRSDAISADAQLTLMEAVEREIMGQVGEWFEFEGDEDD